ncbi:MAG: AmmeMemoRadiSam system protein A [Saccharofermentanales bacterium]|jgi:AmmeMemoRadiSam system protein A|nr:AmmeMemoRadiSam system protein A [Clostridiaceae bacterium]
MPEHSAVAAGFIMPHPPVIVPGINPGPHEASATVTSMRQLAQTLSRIRPDTIVMISPHAPLFSDYVFFYDDRVLEGSFARFGAPRIKLSVRQDSELLREISHRCDQAGIPAGSLTSKQMSRYQLASELDHGVLVPLWFLWEAYPAVKIMAMSCSGLPLAKVYQIGELIRQSAAFLNRRIVIVASGDQSHKVNSESPYGSTPEGAQYDNLLVDCLRENDLPRLLSISGELREKAAECGYRSIVMLCGAFSRRSVLTRLLSYEAPYGIGYCVAELSPDPDEDEPVPDAFAEGLSRHRARIAAGRRENQPPVVIARETLEAHVLGQPVKTIQDFADLPDCAPLFQDRAGVFVSIHKAGELRGCIGTTGPTTPTLAEEIMKNAISAGCRDPRFPPVEPDELPDLTYGVDVLGSPEPVTDTGLLDHTRFGVIVSSGRRSGLLLPDLAGVDSVDEQLAIACRKAGISPEEEYSIQRFTVTRYR